MVSAIPNPALDAFVACLAPELVVAEVLVRQTAEGFDLRHWSDRDTASLRSVSVNDLRGIARFTEHNQFRPLKSSPNLQRGWRCLARTSSELEFALQCLYPGALADWFAAQRPDLPITHYRDFVSRQTGMYRVTTMLNDEQAGQIAGAACHKRFCLKQRLWTAGGLSADGVAEKSLIPCLEPCAVLLEFARTVARIEQQRKSSLALASGEIETLTTALEQILQTSPIDTREADFAAPDNPRRTQWVLNKLKPLLKGKHENA